MATPPQKEVVMANELLRAAHGLGINEKRLIMLAISKLDNRKPATPQNMITRVNVAEMVKAFGIDANSAYKETKLAAEGVKQRYIRFFHHDDDGKPLETVMNWVGRITYKPSAAWVEIAFWHELSPMLFELKKHFTRYQLERVGRLQSMYSWRLFELLMQFKRTGLLKISLQQFHQTLETAPTYQKDFGLLRTRVIDPAIKEIREKDGLDITWEATKTGRKVTALTFTFPVEAQTELPLTPPKASKTPKKRSKATNPDHQDARSRYKGLKDMEVLTGQPMQEMAGVEEWNVFKSLGWVE